MKSHKQSKTLAAALFLLALASAPVHAQLTDVPDLSTATAARTSSTSTAASSTSTPTTAATTDAASSATITSTPAATTAGTPTTSIFHLSDIPTIAGAGIPTLVVPYTAGAPFMQKSTLPQGTVFIAVGAILAFLALCVIVWRAVVAWTINRSVKKAALASIMASDTKGGWLHNPRKPSGKFYSAAPQGSSLSLDALTSSGKPLAGAQHPSARASRVVPSDGSGLFFSPTASTAPGGTPMQGLSSQRSSSYLPAGYYASPSAQVGGGAGNATLGAGLSPSYAGSRRSRVGGSPPASPGLHPQRRSQRLSAQPPRDGSRSRPVSHLNPYANSGLYSQPSTSSLAVGTGIASDDNLPGSRAPSAYLEDLFENHGNGPKERF